MKKIRVRGDFNGVWADERGSMLCLSHGEACKGETGDEITLEEGMELIAFDEDLDKNGQRDDLIAGGIVERAPEWLEGHGSRWVLRIDENGIYNESEKK